MNRYIAIAHMKDLGYSILEIDSMLPFEIGIYGDLEDKKK